MPGIIVDIGTGDGKFTYQLAKENPDRFIIGIDPSQKSLEKTSRKIYKKPAKGGLNNSLFVLADVENLPEELNGIANHVFINFPWGGLLRGLVLAKDKAWNSIKRICQKEAIIDLLFGYNKKYEHKEMERLGLPEINLQYINEKLTPALNSKGFAIEEVKEVLNNDLKKYPSSWAKKMSFGHPRKYYYIRLKVK